VEFHHRPLEEPSVKVSPHSAPILRPVSVGVWQKHRIEIRLNALLDHHLRHAIGYGGHTQNHLTIAAQHGAREWNQSPSLTPYPSCVRALKHAKPRR